MSKKHLNVVRQLRKQNKSGTVASFFLAAADAGNLNRRPFIREGDGVKETHKESRDIEEKGHGIGDGFFLKLRDSDDTNSKKQTE